MPKDFVVSVFNETTLLVEDLTVAKRYQNDIKSEVFSENIWLPGSSTAICFGATYQCSIFIERSDSMNSPEDYEVTRLAVETQKNVKVPISYITETRIGCSYRFRSEGFLHENDVFKFLVVFKNGCKFEKNALLHKMELVVSDANRSDYYDKGVGLDFTILIKDKTIKASKYVLGFHSTVFEAMFQNDWKDSLENTVTIEDVEYEVMLMMVKALHKVPVALDDVRTSLNLLIVADKYCVECVKHQVVIYIKEEINASNVVDVLRTAHQLNIESMKQDALNFMTSNKYKNIEEIDGYNQMPLDLSSLVLNETRRKLFKDQ